MKTQANQNPFRSRPKAAPIDMKAISRRRLAYVDEIEHLSSIDKPSSSFVARAHSLLLPRYWQNANWRARSEILDSVEWLLRLGRKAGFDPLSANK